MDAPSQTMPFSSQYSHQEQHQASSFTRDDHSSRASGTASFARLAGVSPPLEADVNVSQRLGSIQSFDLSTLSNIPGFNSQGSSRSSQGSISRDSQTNPILEWYNSHSDPWTVAKARISGVGAPQGKSKETALNARRIGLPPPFVPFTGTTAPSDCETSPDSGYGTAPRQSLGILSVYGDPDRNTETQSLIDNQSDLAYSSSSTRDACPPSSFSRAAWSQSQLSQPSVTTSHSGKAGLFCHDCNKFVKTKSELNKHHARHTKPHLCKEPNCTRKQGFSTQNDLDRHRRSCHPAASTSGHRFRCNHGACLTKDKLWPRADNFKQHLSRVHKMLVSKDTDLEVYIYRGPQSDHDLAGLGLHPDQYSEFTMMDPGPEMEPIGNDTSLGHDQMSNLAQSMHYSNQFSMFPNFMAAPSHISQPQEFDGNRVPLPGLSMELQEQAVELSRSPEPSVEGRRTQMDGSSPDSHDLYVETRILSSKTPSPHTSQKAPESTSASPMELDSRNSTPAAGRDVEMLEPVEHAPSIVAVDVDDKVEPDVASPTSEISHPSPEDSKDSVENTMQHNPELKSKQRRDGDPKTESEARDMLKRLKESGLLDKAIEGLGYCEAKGVATKPKKTTITSQAGHETLQHPCKECNKSFARPCELKKHKKRHDKPYGCTFLHCQKRFGSKNDWKRHENSQHYQIEVWKCNELLKEDGTETCGKPCHRRETFKYHLDKDHGIDDTKVIEQKLDTCRVGGRSEARFWCGFCADVIESTPSGGGAWKERFNHIDAHYSGRQGLAKKERHEWKEMIPGVETDLTREKHDCGRQKSTVVDVDYDDTSPHSGDASASAQKRKSRQDEPGGSSKKRAKGAIELFWTCCKCPDLTSWSWKSMQVCIGNECGGHQMCDECPTELKRPTEHSM